MSERDWRDGLPGEFGGEPYLAWVQGGSVAITDGTTNARISNPHWVVKYRGKISQLFELGADDTPESVHERVQAKLARRFEAEDGDPNGQ